MNKNQLLVLTILLMAGFFLSIVYSVTSPTGKTTKSCDIIPPCEGNLVLKSVSELGCKTYEFSFVFITVYKF